MDRRHVLLGSIAVIVIAGVALVAGGGFLGGDGDGAPGPSTPTATPAGPATETATATPTATPTPESTPTRQAQLDTFEVRYRQGLRNPPSENVSVPILATSYRETENGTALWLVFDEIEPDSEDAVRRMQLAWHYAAINYMETVRETDGVQPDRLVAVGLNEELADTHFVVETADARRLASGETNLSTFNDAWQEALHGHPRDHEVVQTAIDLMEADGERTPTNSLATDD